MLHTRLIIGTIFGIIGNFLSFGLFASEVPTFYRAIKSNSVKELEPESYLVMTMNFLFWVLYSYGFGLVTHLAYLIIFLLYAKDNEQRKYIGVVFLIELAVIGLVGGLVVGLTHDVLMRTILVGTFCITCGTAMYCPRAYQAFRVCDEESTDCMPFPAVVTNILNDICWMIYASLRFDFILGLTYLGALMVGVIQLVIHAVYYGSTSKFSDDKKLATAEVQLPEINIVDVHKKLLRELVQAHLQKMDKCDDKKLARGGAAPGN